MNTPVTLLFASLICFSPVGAEAPKQDAPIELEVRGVIPLRELEAHAILLTTKDRQVMVPILVDEATALAAAFRLAGQKAPVPFSQDLSAALVHQLGAEVVEVRIDGVRQTEAQGRVLLKQGGRSMSVTTLPADAVLLAIAQGARIYAPPRVVKEAGIRREDLDKVRKTPTPDKEKEQEGVGGSGEVDTL